MASYEDSLEEEIPPQEDDWSPFNEWGSSILGILPEREKTLLPGVLNTCDYNLNSPLIRDHADAILSQLSGRGSSSRYLRNDEIARQVVGFKHLTCDWRNFLSSRGFHRWVAHQIYQKSLPSTFLPSLWNQHKEGHTLAMEVVRDFWKHITKEELPPASVLLRQDWGEGLLKGNTAQRLSSDGEGYWFFHVLTLLMNTSSKMERQSLLDSAKSNYHLGLKEHETDPAIFCYSGLDPNFGRFHVGPGVAVLEDHKRLLDRNMVLMIKDTMAARFCTKLTRLNRASEPSNYTSLERLTELYELGDDIMKSQGNDLFDVLQLLEPFCNERLAQLAGSARPLIPRSTKFSEFLLQEVVKLESRCRGLITPFFQKITLESDYRQVLLYFGCFRHWGHPFIDYLQGLQKLHTQVTLPKVIDETYAKALASDLAYIVLKHEFESRKKWFVDESQLPADHPLRDHIINNTWPTPAQIMDLGDIWADLPITPCYEVPSSIDPSVLYADKSHSPDRLEVLRHVSSMRSGPIPSKKVLQTALERPQRDLKKFLQSVNDEGLPWDSLVIGLKGKEREIKKVGRFFSLMSWDLREYFVSTEYLIKTFFVPLFHGLTMADDLKSLTKKIMESSIGHGHDHYHIIGFSNHLDYEKWNNHQRKTSTSPVFKVMGQFFGLPNLFARTHEFFEKSLIYYGERPDLMEVRNRTMCNRTPDIVCWEGQEGGLEGLRQKGWSVLNLLVILREAKVRNTKVRTLAQGDNQVICTQYKLPEGLTTDDLTTQVCAAARNNDAIMSAIMEGTDKLGLIINQKETLISSDYMSYGKVPVFRGNIEPVESKRYSRVTCIPNDQIPSLGNAISSVATNSLTVAQFSRSIKDPMINYCFFSCLVLTILSFHSPLLRGPLLPPSATPKDKLRFILRALYLDPALGGVSGMSLTRFLIRLFPDPVTEGLSFWKIMYQVSSSSLVKELAITSGHPRLARPSLEALSKLIEKPSSLNVPKGLSATTLLKTEIRKHLIERAPTIPNKLVSKALIYLNREESKMLTFLRSIEPLFPRFLSEFYAATFLGVTESIVGLFQNSRTIRSMFSLKFSQEVGVLIRKSELVGVRVLLAPNSRGVMWSCSSSHADLLRVRSWGSKVYGTTVPHPIEMLSLVTSGTSLCDPCMSGYQTSDHVAVCYPHGLNLSGYRRGKLCAYLGSNTMESTSLLMPWEKDVKLPLLERASKLRSAINWFVEAGSNLALSILANLNSLTGLDWTEDCIEYSRTGSALHRFYSSRQSNGGFASTSPSALSWILVTSDTMSSLAEKNHDFMYQSSLLYSQLISLERNMTQTCYPIQHHFHIGCWSCIREIEEIKINSSWVLSFPQMSNVVSQMSGGLDMNFTRLATLPVERGNWAQLSAQEQCFHVGVAQGSLFGFLKADNDSQAEDSSLFPSNLIRKLYSLPYLIGILKGLHMAAAYRAVYRRTTMMGEPLNTMVGGVYYFIDHLCSSPGFITYLNSPEFLPTLTSTHHRIAPSYPPSAKHLGSLGRGFLQYHVLQKTLLQPHWKHMGLTLWLFSEFRTPRMTGLSVASHRLWELLAPGFWNKKVLLEIVAIKETICYFCSRDRLHTAQGEEKPPNLDPVANQLKNTKWCPSEVRHAVKFIDQTEPVVDSNPWGQEWIGSISKVSLNFSSFVQTHILSSRTPRTNAPLISGLRSFQFATGAHYKLRAILATLPPIRGFLCGGDGSGGMTAAILRWSPTAKGIFNSLLDLSDRHLRGVAPGPPSALAALPESMRTRCVNWNTCWKDPSDLSNEMTWIHFLKLRQQHQLSLNLLVFDMEVVNDEMSLKIELLLRKYLGTLLDRDGCLIYKMYGTREEARHGQGLSALGCLFRQSDAVVTSVTSSLSSEFYLVGKGLITEKIIAKHLTADALFEVLTTLPANKDLLSEFQRALKLNPKELMMGIPSCLIPSAEVEFTSIFSELGLETGIAAHFSQILSFHSLGNIEPLGLILSGLLLLSNSIVNTTRWIQHDYAPPSDQRLQKLLSGFLGVWEFVAWLYRQYPIWYRTRFFYDHPVYFCYNVTERFSRGRRGRGLEWDWFSRHWQNKRLIKVEHPATIGQVIRVLSRFWSTQHTHVPSWPVLRDAIRFHLGSFNKGLLPDDVLHHTGLFFPLLGPRLFCTSNWEAEPFGELPSTSYTYDPWNFQELTWSN
ncbi:MAG: RNA-dependent RNA polymerase [Nanning Rhabd tick virus 1]|uniref:Replicase n=1 Tax=Nanning Rhabd tick virus 1 TaxID=2972321 RepID=A0A9E7V2B0_9RHAB|nr:MAG: RNA-dependent RNA polymerase [Nanning Rhabd tick virus 1]